MARSRSWYCELSNRAQHYGYTSYPYTHENLERARVLKELRESLWELVTENEEQAAEIKRLKGLLEKENTAKEKTAKRRKTTRNER